MCDLICSPGGQVVGRIRLPVGSSRQGSLVHDKGGRLPVRTRRGCVYDAGGLAVVALVDYSTG